MTVSSIEHKSTFAPNWFCLLLSARCIQLTFGSLLLSIHIPAHSTEIPTGNMAPFAHANSQLQS